jgi:hypothetical protein
VGLERGPLSLVSTTEELLGRKSGGSCLENREYGRKGQSRCPRGIDYPQKLALTSPISGGRSVGIVRPRTQAKELVLPSRESYIDRGGRTVSKKNSTFQTYISNERAKVKH